MNISLIVTYGDLLFIGTALGLYFWGFKRGENIGKQEAYRQSYQNSLNDKIEELLYDQKKKGSE